LSHTSSPFCCSYFQRWDVMKYLPELASNYGPPDLSFPSR
jgi:hypothetical protein